MNLDSFNRAYNFCRLLQTKPEMIWVDNIGQYRIIIGENTLNSRLLKLSSYSVMKEKTANSIYLDPKHNNNSYDYLISVGSFHAHNNARLKCMQKGIKLITIPVPLTNDSFCTDRCSNPGSKEQSYKGLFPHETIIETTFLHNLPKEINVLGLGEFSGIYFSIIDYFLSRDLAVPSSLLNNITKWLQELVLFYSSDYNKFLMGLASALLFKGLVMRTNGDHQVGCGIDHLLAGVIEDKTGFPHGKAVFWGGLQAMQYFPEWEQYGLSYAEMQDYGKTMGFVTKESSDVIAGLDSNDLVRRALIRRPSRPTMLRML